MICCHLRYSVLDALIINLQFIQDSDEGNT